MKEMEDNTGKWKKVDVRSKNYLFLNLNIFHKVASIDLV